MDNPLPSYLERTRVVKNKKILEAFGAIDRADFVLEEYKSMAYADEALPIPAGQTISQPYTVAFMLELLDPKPGEKIMDVGAGSGWQTPLLAFLVSRSAGSLTPGVNEKTPGVFPPAGKVFAVERIPELCEFGKGNVAKYNFIEKGIVEWFCQDATPGLPERAPFDAIIAAASISDFKVPKAWEEQLKVGGKIVVPIGNSVWLWIKQKGDTFYEKEFPGFVFVPFIKNE